MGKKRKNMSVENVITEVRIIKLNGIYGDENNYEE